MTAPSPTGLIEIATTKMLGTEFDRDTMTTPARCGRAGCGMTNTESRQRACLVQPSLGACGRSLLTSAVVSDRRSPAPTQSRAE